MTNETNQTYNDMKYQYDMDTICGNCYMECGVKEDRAKKLKCGHTLCFTCARERVIEQTGCKYCPAQIDFISYEGLDKETFFYCLINNIDIEKFITDRLNAFMNNLSVLYEYLLFCLK